MKFSESVLSFFNTLHFPFMLEDGLAVMNPFNDEQVKNVCKKFYGNYYHDHHERRMIIGINPGRFGGGITGIPFTDPIRLEQQCKIANSFDKKRELSSVFIYEMINAYGSIKNFYNDYYITSVSPLGFTKNNNNLNYYDDKILKNIIKEFVVDCMLKQLSFGIKRDVAFCLGDGKNYSFMNRLNEENKFFEKIIPLSHPRYIMQYKSKKKDAYISYYLDQLNIKSEV